MLTNDRLPEALVIAASPVMLIDPALCTKLPDGDALPTVKLLLPVMLPPDWFKLARVMLPVEPKAPLTVSSLPVMVKLPPERL